MLWDVRSRSRVTESPLFVKQGAVESVAFSPNGKTIAAGYKRGEFESVGGVVLLNVDLGSWKQRAAEIANRNFTHDEWRRYFRDQPYHASFPSLPVLP